MSVSEAFQVYLSILNKTVKQSILLQYSLSGITFHSNLTQLYRRNFFSFSLMVRTIHWYCFHLDTLQAEPFLECFDAGNFDNFNIDETFLFPGLQI